MDEIPEVEVKYELRIWADAILIYEDEFGDEEDLQSSGLRKADHAINEFRQEKIDDLIADEEDLLKD